MSLKTAKKGDILIDDEHNTCKVIDRINDIFFLSKNYNHNEDDDDNWYSKKCLEKNGWTLKQSEPPCGAAWRYCKGCPNYDCKGKKELKPELGKVYEDENGHRCLYIQEIDNYFAFLNLNSFTNLYLLKDGDAILLFKLSSDQRPYRVKS